MKKYLISIIMVAFSFALLSCGDNNPLKKDGGSPPITPPASTTATLDDTLWVQINPTNPAIDTPREAFLTGWMSIDIAFFHQGKACYDVSTLSNASLFTPVFGNPIPSANYNLTYLSQCGAIDRPTFKKPYTLNLHGGSTLGGATGTINGTTTFTISADGLTMDVFNHGSHNILTKAVPSPPLS